jgi:histone demethylase JARID1
MSYVFLYLLSHVQNELSPETESFVQQELRGIVTKERAQREQLWSSGVVKSTRMAPRACQDHISMEEVHSMGKLCSHF